MDITRHHPCSMHPLESGHFCISSSSILNSLHLIAFKGVDAKDRINNPTEIGWLKIIEVFPGFLDITFCLL